MKRRHLTLIPVLLLLLSCGPEGLERFGSLSLEGQRGLSDGIVIARTLREAGKVSREKNLSLARRARTVAALHRSSMDFTLNAGTDGLEAKPLADQLESLRDEARALVSEGAVELDGNTRLVFDLSAMLAENRLEGLIDELKSKPGVRLELTPKAREKLARARDAAERNIKTLDEAISRLQ